MKRNKKDPRAPTLSGTEAALLAARTLDPADLKKILDEKQPANTEEQQKSVVAALLEKAKELPGEELAKLVAGRQAELRALEILHLQRNVNGIALDKPELDGLLNVFLKLEPARRQELAAQIQHAALMAGLQQGPQLDHFAHKLARIGIHT